MPTTKILLFFSKTFYIQAHQGTSAPDGFSVLSAQLPAFSLFARPKFLSTPLSPGTTALSDSFPFPFCLPFYKLEKEVVSLD